MVETDLFSRASQVQSLPKGTDTGPVCIGFQETHIGRRAQIEKWSSTSGVTLKCGERLCLESFISVLSYLLSPRQKSSKVHADLLGAYPAVIEVSLMHQSQSDLEKWPLSHMVQAHTNKFGTRRVATRCTTIGGGGW